MCRNVTGKGRVLILVCLLLFVIGNGVEYAGAGDNEWTPIGLYGATVEAAVVDPSNPSIVWCATNAGLFRSIDRGHTWARIGEGLLPRGLEDVAVGADDGAVVYTVGQQGVYRSTNAGIDWTKAYTGSSWAIAVSPINPDLILFGGSMGGIWRSADGGVSWMEGRGDVPVNMVREITFAPGAPHIVYAAGFGGIWKSIDWGDTWSAAHGGFVNPPNLYSVAVDPYDSQVLYIGTANDGLYRSSNGGVSWTPIGTGLGTSHVTTISIHPGNQQVIYVGGGVNPGTGIPGVYRSLDSNGASWAPLMSGLGSRAVYHLGLDRDVPLTLYAGTQGGAWKYTVVSGPEDLSISINDGALFTNRTDVELHLTAPSGTTEMIISNDGGFGGASWEPYSTRRAWTITSVGEYVLPRTVYAKFRTRGVVSGLYQDDIVLDITAPTGAVTVTEPLADSSSTVVALQESSGPAVTAGLSYSLYLPSVSKNHRPGYELIGLRMSASDDLSGVSDVLVSGDLGFSGSQWEPFRAEGNWWVRDDATSVYVRFRDRAGNESDVVSDAIRH